MNPLPQHLVPLTTMAGVLDDDEAGQALVFGAKPIGYPRTERGASEKTEPVFIWQTPPA